MFYIVIVVFGEGTKVHVLTKHVKKNTFLFSLGFSNHSLNQWGVNGLGFIVIFLLIHFIVIL